MSFLRIKMTFFASRELYFFYNLIPLPGIVTYRIRRLRWRSGVEIFLKIEMPYPGGREEEGLEGYWKVIRRLPIG